MDQTLTENMGLETGFDIAAARVTIDTGAIVANWRALAALSGKAETGAVLKADAYGLGAGPVARALGRAGCRTFFVATVPEGVELRAAVPDARIFVLLGLWPGWEASLIASNLIQVLASDEQLVAFRAMGLDHAFALNFDTGMNRLGFAPEEAAALAAMGEKPVMVMSHLACSGERDHPLNIRQRESFQTVRRCFEGIESSLSSSGAIYLGPDYHCDLTRPGIALYGGEPIADEPNPMRSVVHAEARILQIRQAAAGEFISYGATHKLTRDSRLAIVGAGYADGWQRALSGSGVPLRQELRLGGHGFVAGHKVPVLGRVTMDLTTFDVTDVEEDAVRTGDYISLFGHGITLDEAAHSAGTIAYELLTSLGKRYERRYI
jgi:alanine racemase